MTTATLDRRTLLTAAIAAAWLPGNSALGQPASAPISIIVPQPAGNATDGMARKAAPVLQKALGHPVIVENFPGAGGSIGVAKALATPGDGQAMTIGSQSELILAALTYSSAKYRPEDFRLIALTGITPFVLVARPDLPANTLADLAAMARGPAPPPVAIGHIGLGTLTHQMSEQLARKLGIPMVQVPYKGTPPIVQDLMGGQIDFTFLPLAGSTVSLIETGKLKALATTAAAMNPALPKVEPLVRQDSAIKDFLYIAWGGVFVSAKTTPPALQRLHKAFIEVLEDAEIKAWSAGTGVRLEPPRSLGELEQFYGSEIRKYRALAREIGITPQ
jgi:tripartite-type tricarboxylate transporter receptor subunit TctC